VNIACTVTINKVRFPVSSLDSESRDVIKYYLSFTSELPTLFEFITNEDDRWRAGLSVSGFCNSIFTGYHIIE
jgi:hypothetical protein